LLLDLRASFPISQNPPDKIRCVLTKKREADLPRANETVRVMNVKKVKNIGLAISLLGFAIGFSDLRENIFFWLGRPVGAIAFIAFFIFLLLEKEYAIMDEQDRARFATLNFKTNSAPASKGSNKEIRAPALTTAVSH
jgi:hypothetical protein